MGGETNLPYHNILVSQYNYNTIKLIIYGAACLVEFAFVPLALDRGVLGPLSPLTSA